MAEKKKPQFQILSGKSTTHNSYYTGSLNLNNLSSVLIEGDTAKIDLGLKHAKSRVERGIKFSADESAAPNGKLYWIVWVAIDHNEKGPYYAGVTACPMRIDAEAREGWKNLALHVNRMDDALKRRIKVAELPSEGKKALTKLLTENSREMWDNSSDELKEALTP